MHRSWSISLCPSCALTVALLRWLPSHLERWPFTPLPCAHHAPGSFPSCAHSGSFPSSEASCDCCHELFPGSLHSGPLFILQESSQRSLPPKASADHLPMRSPRPASLYPITLADVFCSIYSCVLLFVSHIVYCLLSPGE